MNRIAGFIIGALIFPLLVFGQRPMMMTQHASTLGKGHHELGIGFEYLEKHVSPSPDVPQSMLRLFVVAIHQGIAENVDFDLDWRGRLIAQLDDGKREFDWGDLTVSTKINFFRERGYVPSVGVRNAVKLPNTTYALARLGSNQMDFHSHVLLSKHVGNIQTRLNLGFSIIGDPRSAGEQDDVYSLGAAVLLPFRETHRLFFELHGFTGYEDHDDKLVGRLGLFLNTGGIEYRLFSSIRILGNNRDFATAFEGSENWSVGIMVTRAFKLHLFD
ncbi:MAG TPA: hypothetical protein DCP63_02300 [Bacteroidetes bacterium]|nr:hypothetical protein [Bacteroidota bacterium]